MKHLKFIYLLLFLALFIFGGFFTGRLEKNKQNKQNLTSKPTPAISQVHDNKNLVNVIRVIDGDTIKVDISGRQETVRLIGIDAPETVDPRKPVQCFGREASNKAKEILTGKTITLEADPTQGDRDKYQRLLRYVFIDGENFNKFMISSGYAHEYTYQSNPYKYQAEFIAAEKSAREKKVGLWANNACP